MLEELYKLLKQIEKEISETVELSTEQVLLIAKRYELLELIEYWEKKN